VLAWAHELTSETVALMVPDGDDAICVDVRESAHPLLVAAFVGARAECLHAGAVGKLFLAARDDAAIDRYLAEHAPLRRYTARTPVTPDAVWAELSSVRAQGYAVSDEEVEVGMYGIAAPVRDRRGAVKPRSRSRRRCRERARRSDACTVRSSSRRAGGSRPSGRHAHQFLTSRSIIPLFHNRAI
jgi:DNA-binding IclR family transcriptional regulator